MKKVGDYVSKLVREQGQLLTGEYPYVFSHDLYSFLIWERDTGEIVWVGEEGQLGGEGYQIAWNKVIELNDLNPYAPIMPRVRHEQ